MEWSYFFRGSDVGRRGRSNHQPEREALVRRTAGSSLAGPVAAEAIIRDLLGKVSAVAARE